MCQKLNECYKITHQAIERTAETEQLLHETEHGTLKVLQCGYSCSNVFVVCKRMFMFNVLPTVQVPRTVFQEIYSPVNS